MTLFLSPDYQISFESTGFSVQEQKFDIDFQDGFTIRTILASFDLQVASILPKKFRVNWPPDLGEENRNRFSRWRSFWISD